MISKRQVFKHVFIPRKDYNFFKHLLYPPRIFNNGLKTVTVTVLVEEISDSETTDSLTVTGTWSNMRPVWLRGCATWSFGQKGPCEWGWLWRRDRGGGRRIKWRLIMPRSTLRTGVKPLPPLTTWPNDPPGQWPTWPPGPMHHMANGQLGQLAHDLPGARAIALAHLPASSSTGCFFWLVPPKKYWNPLWKYLNFLHPRFETCPTQADIF